MPWNEKFECMPVEQIQQFQVEKLRETIDWVAKRVPFYKKGFKEAGVKAADIKGIEDVAKLPFTVKNDLRDNYPFGLCAVPLKRGGPGTRLLRDHRKPITGPYTADDLDQWGECMARNFHAAGVRPEHVVQNAYGHGLFTGGLGFHQGATVMGCTVVPTSAGLTERQITLMKDFGAHVLCCTPFLCPDHCRAGRRTQGGPQKPAPVHRHFRCRALDDRDARGN
jgi:phenylacetate-CoA ligase